jgi:hypothetical protein
MSDYVSERHIKNILGKLAKQRVAMILQPGNVWVIENAVESRDEKVASVLQTCQMRGWVDTLSDALPTGKLVGEGDTLHLPDKFTGIEPLYRLTEAGWDVIHNSHNWVMITFFVALASLIASILSILINRGTICLQ